MSIRPNRVKQKFAAGEVAAILSGTNGTVDYADLGNVTRACDLWGMTSIVRAMDNDYATIYRTLNRGAQGIVVPHVNTRAEAVVEAAKFAPLGERAE